MVKYTKFIPLFSCWFRAPYSYRISKRLDYVHTHFLVRFFYTKCTKGARLNSTTWCSYLGYHTVSRHSMNVCGLRINCNQHTVSRPPIHVCRLRIKCTYQRDTQAHAIDYSWTKPDVIPYRTNFIHKDSGC